MQMTIELINGAQKMAVACIKSNYRECGVDVVTTTNQQQVLTKVTNLSSLKVSFKAQPLLKRKQLQYALKELGLYSSSIDGIFGRNTAKALSSFQRIQAVEENNPEELFELIVSKVDVPSSFGTSTSRQTNSLSAKNKPEKPKYQAAMGYRPYGNTTMSVQQAIDVCESGAKNAFDTASNNARFKSNSYSGNCTGYGSSSNCRVRHSSPYGNDMGTALAIGLMGGISRGLASNAAMIEK